MPRAVCNMNVGGSRLYGKCIIQNLYVRECRLSGGSIDSLATVIFSQICSQLDCKLLSAQARPQEMFCVTRLYGMSGVVHNIRTHTYVHYLNENSVNLNMYCMQ